MDSHLSVYCLQFDPQTATVGSLLEACTSFIQKELGGKDDRKDYLADFGVFLPLRGEQLYLEPQQRLASLVVQSGDKVRDGKKGLFHICLGN